MQHSVIKTENNYVCIHLTIYLYTLNIDVNMFFTKHIVYIVVALFNEKYINRE